MDKEAELKLEMRRDEIYIEWKKFLLFWWEHLSLTHQECFTIYMMQAKKEEAINSNVEDKQHE